VDELGNLEDAVRVAAKLAGIKGEPDIVDKKEKTSVIDFLRGKLPEELSDLFPTVKIKYVFAP
jgi:protease-4